MKQTMATRDENTCATATAARPFIHKIATDHGRYIFDVNTGEIFRVDEVTWEIMEDSCLSEAEVIAKHAPRFTPAEIAAAYREIGAVRADNGYFSNDHPSVALAVSPQDVHHALTRGRRQLILEVTERCNFGCTYCQLKFPGAGVAPRGARDMDWETARAAIDDFLRHCCSAEPQDADDEHSPNGVLSPARWRAIVANSVFVSFYGGEPLLNFPLIQRCTDYVLQKAKGKVYFALTTNGYFLEGDKAEYLQAHNFMVMVSFDGPASCHDEHRRTKDGMPTHRVVLDHLRAFIRRCPKQVSINAVVAQGTDVRDVHRYFTSAEWIPPGTRVRIAPASSPCPEYRRSPAGTKEFAGWRELRRGFVERLVKGRILPAGGSREVSLAADMLFDDLKELHHGRWRVAQRRQESKPCTPPGPCVGGLPRMYVSVTGEYYPCERVLSRETYRIGSVGAGLDEEKAYHLLREFLECNRQECEQCWCLPLCSIGCYATVWDHEGFSVQVKRRACAQARRAVHRSLQDYCAILEQNPRALHALFE